MNDKNEIDEDLAARNLFIALYILLIGNLF